MTGRAGRDARLRKVRLILSEGSLTDRRVRTAGEQITRVSFGYRNAVRIRLAGLVVTRCLDELHVRVRAVAGLVGNASIVRAAIDRVRGRREGVAVLRSRTHRHDIDSRTSVGARIGAGIARCHAWLAGTAPTSSAGRTDELKTHEQQGSASGDLVAHGLRVYPRERRDGHASAVVRAGHSDRL